jgi:hypothetical protein
LGLTKASTVSDARNLPELVFARLEILVGRLFNYSTVLGTSSVTSRNSDGIKNIKFNRRIMMTDMDSDFYGRAHLIQKRPVLGVLQTTKQLIRGTFHSRGMKRVIDELAIEETFVAITDAKIFTSRKMD